MVNKKDQLLEANVTPGDDIDGSGGDIIVRTGPKKFVFTLMPFDEKFDDIYKLGIKPACISAGAYCERVDEQIFNEGILERIYNQIAKADLIVADMTGQNPNVFYETGYAHALNKRVILLTQNAADIPFDLKHYPHIVYGGKITLLIEQLEKKVSWYINQPVTPILEAERVLSFYINDQLLEENCLVYQPMSGIEWFRAGSTVIIKLSLHNPSSKVLDISNLRFGLIIPKGAPLVLDMSIALPDGTSMEKISDVGREISPHEWRLRKIGLRMKTDEDWLLKLQGYGQSGEIRRALADLDHHLRSKDHVYEMCLRIFSERGTRDIKFKLSLFQDLVDRMS